MKKAIYTVITGGYDALPEVPKYKGWDTILFTDSLPMNPKGWDIVMMDKEDDPVIHSRAVKILSHEYLPSYDLVCYVDANQRLLREPPSTPIWFTHPRRKSIYEEARQLILNGRFKADDINAMMQSMIDRGYKDWGLYLNGFFVRDNHDWEINALHNIWFEETERYVPRDQLTLPFAIWATGVLPTNIQSYKSKESYAVVTKAHA